MNESGNPNYDESQFLRNEATKDGVIVPEVLDAIIEREMAIDRIVREGKSAIDPQIFDQQYRDAAKQVKELKEKHGVTEPVYTLDSKD